MGLIVVTGADGFIGTALVRALARKGHRVRAVVRVNGPRRRAGVDSVTAVGDLAEVKDWSETVGGAEAVVHLAARAHRSDAAQPGAIESYRRVNRDATLRLAAAAVDAGVRRFVFLSSIGVMGERTTDRPFMATDPLRPQAAYAVSKAEAEEGLTLVSMRTGLELVVIRPPLVVGAGAPGNLARLVRLIRAGVPLPFGSVRNRRTLVALDDLVTLITTCIEHPGAVGAPLLAGDATAISTPGIVASLARGLGRPTRLWPVPVAMLRALGSIGGAAGQVQKLIDSLEIDTSETHRRVQWSPSTTTEAALAEAAAAWGNPPQTKG